jgi:hypothetical protein
MKRLDLLKKLCSSLVVAKVCLHRRLKVGDCVQKTLLAWTVNVLCC